MGRERRAILVVVLATLAAPAGAEEPSRSRRVLRAELTPQLRLSVERGFRFLVAHQLESGSFSGEFPVAVNALAGMAFLSAGHSATIGPYAEAFEKGLVYLLSKQHATGYFDDGKSMMYGHGFATLFLAEAYGMSGKHDQAIGAALRRAVRLIESSQTTDGSWDYAPSGPRGRGDTSITVCQTMALRAARNLGLAVNAQTIDRAKAFILRAQTSDGGFAYQVGRKYRLLSAEESAFPRSAAGVCILLSLGDYDSDAVRNGFLYLTRRSNDFNVFPYYADYYCTQAMFQAGGRHWKEYFDHVSAKLLRKQRSDGSWRGGIGGEAQSTAMALIALQVPNRYLPIGER